MQRRWTAGRHGTRRLFLGKLWQGQRRSAETKRHTRGQSEGRKRAGGGNGRRGCTGAGFYPSGGLGGALAGWQGAGGVMGNKVGRGSLCTRALIWDGLGRLKS